MQSGSSSSPIRLNQRGDIHIPHDLTVEILKKLPGKSLARFKSVSKLWSSTIISMSRDLIDSIVTDSMSIFNRAKTYVLWDVEDCPIPPDLTPTDALINIRTVLMGSGYFGCGSLSIRPYCRHDIEGDDFGCQSVSLVTSDKEDTRGMFIVDLFAHAIMNRSQPLNLVLIMGDISERKDFFRVFRLLQSRSRCRIILAQSPNPSEEKLSLTIDGLRKGLSAGQDLLSKKL